ncbi:MAG: Lrp/AsnC family transcriptional regulator [Gammaproteobacteria bacterium]|nr:Lrp/AsnC family transcriptional regulator [Gammaproteobacteria bacterium]
MDNKDKKIIALLRENARTSTSELARKMGMSRTTIQDRINKLENKGIISGYTVMLSKEVLQNTVTAHVTVKIEPYAQTAAIVHIQKMDSARALFTISGEYDLIVILEADNTATLDTALDKLTSVKGIERTKTSIILSTKFER